jgi:predicted N-formylglutamate amidohydrolase
LKALTRKIILSCEHGGNRIPSAYRNLFRNAAVILKTHRGLDIGALAIAKQLSSSLAAPLVYSEVSRLLVDLNRSPHHRRLLSEYTRDCDETTRARILDHHYFPYQRKLERLIRDRVSQKNKVLHLSIHTFTPKLDGKIRNADIGLLYDPARANEAKFSRELQKVLQQIGLRVRRNYPYRGNADGMTTYLRSVLTVRSYLGIEIEINQNILIRYGQRIGRLLATALHSASTPGLP